MAATHRARKITAAGVCLLTGLLLVLVLACGGQEGTGNPRLAQKPAESGIGLTGRGAILQPENQRQTYVADEVLIKFNPGTDAETIERIRSALKLETIRKFSSPNLFLMKITDGSSVESIIEQLKTYEAVKYAEPNYVVKAIQ